VHPVSEVGREDEGDQEDRFERRGEEEGDFEVPLAADDAGERFGTDSVEVKFFPAS
jgi:hypothetical protein